MKKETLNSSIGCLTVSQILQTPPPLPPSTLLIPSASTGPPPPLPPLLSRLVEASDLLLLCAPFSSLHPADEPLKLSPDARTHT